MTILDVLDYIIKAETDCKILILYSGEIAAEPQVIKTL
jgi:hypothetical protein